METRAVRNLTSIDEDGLHITLPHIDFGAGSPEHPPDATEWERHEIDATWREAYQHATHLARAVASIAAQLLDNPRALSTFDGAIGNGVPTHSGLRLEYAVNRLQHRWDGAIHRVKMAESDSRD